MTKKEHENVTRAMNTDGIGMNSCLTSVIYSTYDWNKYEEDNIAYKQVDT